MEFSFSLRVLQLKTIRRLSLSLRDSLLTPCQCIKHKPHWEMLLPHPLVQSIFWLRALCNHTSCRGHPPWPSPDHSSCHLPCLWPHWPPPCSLRKLYMFCLRAFAPAFPFACYVFISRYLYRPSCVFFPQAPTLPLQRGNPWVASACCCLDGSHHLRKHRLITRLICSLFTPCEYIKS